MLILNPLYKLKITRDSVYAVSDKDTLFFSSKQICDVIRVILKGNIVEDKLIDMLSKLHPFEDIYFALNKLKKLHIVKDIDSLKSGLLSKQEIWIGEEVEGKVCLFQFGNVSSFTTILSEKLKKYGVEILSEPAEKSLCLLIGEHYLYPEIDFTLSKLNNNNWLFIKPSGYLPFFTPILGKSSNHCWDCLKRRIKTNKPFETFLFNNIDETKEQYSINSYLESIEIFSSIIVHEYIKWKTLKESDIFKDFVHIDITNLSINKNKLSPEQYCFHLKNENHWINEKSEVVLNSQPKTFFLDGGHRSVFPEETLSIISHLSENFTGIMSPLKSLSKNDNGGTFSFFTNYYVEKEFKSLNEIRNSTIANSAFGKGFTESQAKASAMCEAIERYCGHFSGNEISIKSSYKMLNNAIQPELLLGFSEQQYLERNGNTKHVFSKVPKRITSDTQLDWSRIWSLTNNTEKLVPTAFCYYDYPADKIDSKFLFADSNGNASGNNIEEAILQGYLELIERDCVGIWWYNMIKMPSVDIGSFANDKINRFVKKYENLERKIWVLDITNDLGVPTFASISSFVHAPQETILLGFGSHLDPQVALLRALSEMDQCRFLFSREKQIKDDYNDVIKDWIRNASLRKYDYLLPCEKQKQKKAKDYIDLSSNDLKADIKFLLKKTNEIGLETLVLNQSKESINLAVVKVIIPGLCHFWPRFGFRRLYQIPVSMGWRQEEITENKLNQTPMFL
jgi:bacteriocin biosynthesis cyclodehydratase domain-containing protein